MTAKNRTLTKAFLLLLCLLYAAWGATAVAQQKSDSKAQFDWFEYEGNDQVYKAKKLLGEKNP